MEIKDFQNYLRKSFNKVSLELLTGIKSLFDGQVYADISIGVKQKEALR